MFNRCRNVWVGLPAGALLLVGCASSKLPKTYPAGGSVVYQGGQPMKGGSIQFRSTADPDLRVTGKIKEDGTFTLETMKDRERAAGAPEGEYKVSIMQPLEGDHPALEGKHKGVPPIELSAPYTVKAEKNEFKIVLDVPAPK
jgi:hypothetical protein